MAGYYRQGFVPPAGDSCIREGWVMCQLGCAVDNCASGTGLQSGQCICDPGHCWSYTGDITLTSPMGWICSKSADTPTMSQQKPISLSISRVLDDGGGEASDNDQKDGSSAVSETQTSCTDDKCTSADGKGGYDCWAGHGDPFSCSDGYTSQKTGRTTVWEEDGKTYQEYECCTSKGLKASSSVRMHQGPWSLLIGTTAVALLPLWQFHM